MKDQTTLRIHPACDAFPPMQQDEWEDFVADIRDHGVRQPVLIYHGEIIDGKHRWKACQDLGVVCPTQEWDPGQNDSIAALVTSLNRHRRHMTVTQKAGAAAELEPLFKEAAAERQKRGKTLGSIEPKGRAIDEAARAVGVSSASARRAKALKEQAPEQFEAVKRGEKTVHAATVEMKRPKAPPPPPRTESEPEPVVDPTGRPVTDEKVLAALDHRQEFRDLVNEAHALKRKILALAKTEVGAELRAQQIRRDFENIITAIEFAVPYTTCPYMPNCPRGCATCSGKRWITEDQLGRIPEEDRR